MPGIKKNMVWLASYPKSGNTWFRIFLSNLFSESPGAVHINELTETAISSNRSIMDNYLGIHSSELTTNEIDRLRPEVFRSYSKEKEGLAYIKTHEAWTVNSRDEPIFPEEVTKGVIYMIRNPLDIVISYSHHNNESIDLTISRINNADSKLCAAKDVLYMQTEQRIKSWSDHVSSWTKGSGLPLCLIRYEDMLQDPLNTFKSAVDFLNLSYGEAEISDAINYSSFQSLKAMEARDGFKEKGINTKVFFRKGQSNEWKTGLSKAQMREIVSNHEVIMKQYGYLK